MGAAALVAELVDRIGTEVVEMRISIHVYLVLESELDRNNSSLNPKTLQSITPKLSRHNKLVLLHPNQVDHPKNKGMTDTRILVDYL